MKLITLFVLIGLFTISSNLSAQQVIEMKSKTNGFSAGVHVGYLSYQDDQIHPSTDNGLGYGAHIQYGFNHKFAIDLAFQHYAVKSKSSNNINSPYPYTELDCTARFSFGSTNTQLRPFLLAGVNYTRSQELFEDPFTFFQSLETYSGYGFAGGFGVSYFVQPEISIDITLLVHSGSYVNTTINGADFQFDHSYLSYIGLGGISYHF